MDAASRTSLVVLAVLATGAVLYWLADVLAPFMLALFLWLVIDGFADAIHKRFKIGGKHRVSPPVALILALVIVAAGAVATVIVIADSATEFASQAEGYGERLDQVIGGIYDAASSLFGLPPERPSTRELLSGLNFAAFLREIARATQSLVSNGILICIYVAFLFAAEAGFTRRMATIFPDAEERKTARETAGAIRKSVQQFVWVQTWTGAIPAMIAWIVLEAVGLDNALFWSFLIFLICYVPTIGPIVATALPSLFAVVQFDEPWRIAAVLIGVAAPLFVMGNIIQPRMQGESMNLSTIVVLLGLAIWGKIWGITGMFLSSPLTVAIMVILAHQPSAYWLAVLMSADGRPDKGREKKPQQQAATKGAKKSG
jgi:predicted PurR-regulated permease PerM